MSRPAIRYVPVYNAGTEPIPLRDALAAGRPDEALATAASQTEAVCRLVWYALI